MKRAAFIGASIVVVFVYYWYCNRMPGLQFLFLPLIFFLLLYRSMDQRLSLTTALLLGLLCDLHTPFIGPYMLSFGVISFAINWMQTSLFGYVSYRSIVATLILATMLYFSLTIFFGIIAYGPSRLIPFVRGGVYAAIVVVVSTGVIETMRRLSQRLT